MTHGMIRATRVTMNPPSRPTLRLLFASNFWPKEDATCRPAGRYFAPKPLATQAVAAAERLCFNSRVRKGQPVAIGPRRDLLTTNDRRRLLWHGRSWSTR